MLKQLVAGAALGLLALSPAIGQGNQGNTAQQTTGGTPSANNFLQQQTASEWRSSKLVGASVRGPDNQSIGEISDLLVDQSGNIHAVVVGVGGFLGIGEKNVAIPFKNLTVERKSDGNTIDHVTVTYTKDQLKSAPTFTYLASK
jgi:sporulation protein YlmC with PRC-barrel domain